MGIYQAAGVAGRGLGGILGLWFRWKIVMFFFIFILISSISLGVQEGSIEPVIKDLGERFITPTYKLHQEVLDIKEKGIVYEKSPHFWGGLWKLILTYWSLITNFYIIILWLAILARIFKKFPLMNDSATASAWVIAFGVFIGIQMLLIATMRQGSIWDPLVMFKDLFKALPHLIKPFSETNITAIE